MKYESMQTIYKSIVQENTTKKKKKIASEPLHLLRRELQITVRYGTSTLFISSEIYRYVNIKKFGAN